MFSDTHFHFRLITEDRGLDGVEFLSKMAEKKCFFGLDIGTEADDLLKRQSCIEKTIAGIKDVTVADKVRKFVYFAAGIWPSVDEIHDRENRMKILKENIDCAAQDKNDDILNRKIVAVGECGLDHHWNPEGVDGRCESDFDEKTYKGERELFEMQLLLGKQMNLPVIVHSRDAFEDTYDCIKNIGYHNGIIHCYSYGIEEAEKFLDLGWYISLSGAVTYTKKSKVEEMKKMINFIPEDRLLLETDAPYLAPVPCRGQINTPVLVEHTYNFVAAQRGIEVEKLSYIVDENVKKLFGISLD